MPENLGVLIRGPYLIKNNDVALRLLFDCDQFLITTLQHCDKLLSQLITIRKLFRKAVNYSILLMISKNVFVLSSANLKTIRQFCALK